MEELKLTSPQDLLKKTWKRYKERVWIYARILIIPIAFFIVFGLINIFIFSLISNNKVVDLILSLIVVIATMITYAWSWTALYFAINDRKGQKTIKEYYMDSQNIIWRYVLTLIMLSAIASLGFILLVVPGIIFVVWFSFSLFILVYEKEGIFASISKSKEYTKNLFWPILGRLAFIALVAFLAGIILSFISKTLIYGESLESFRANLIQIINSLFVYPFFVSYLYYLYKNVKKFKSK